MDLRLVSRLLAIEPVRALARNKVRAGLAMLGNTVGVASVVWVVAIGGAGKQRAMDQLDQLGVNLVWVEAGSRNVAGVRTGALGMTTLTAADAQAIRDEVPLIASVSENVDGSIQVVNRERNVNTRFRGVSSEYVDIKSWHVARGAFFTDADVQNAARVLVVGETVRHDLFGDSEAVGESVRINGTIFEVIAVLAPKGQSASGQDQDDTVMMPWTTARKRIQGRDITWLDDILCSAISTEAVGPAADDITALLRQRHHIGDGEIDFNIRHPEDLVRQKISDSETFEMLLLCLAGIALIVSGVGIMNIMLASVVQRTREIGVRVAVGATPRAIQLQLLGEAIMLTFGGGGLGVALAVAGAPLVEDALGWSLAIPVSILVLSVAASITTGVVFGFYPAWRASRLDPIESLRHG